MTFDQHAEAGAEQAEHDAALERAMARDRMWPEVITALQRLRGTAGKAIDELEDISLEVSDILDRCGK